MKIFTKSWFNARLNFAIKSAGRRYTPQANVSLPINRVLDWLARTQEFYKEFIELEEAFHKEWEESSLPRMCGEIKIPTKPVDQLKLDMDVLIKFVKTCQNQLLST